MKRLIVPIFLNQAGCPEPCVYCNQAAMSPERDQAVRGRRGLPDEGEVRARIDAYLESASRAKKPFGAREIAFYGGTFTGLPAAAQEGYLSLARAYVARGVVQGLRVSTHPAMLSAQAVARLQLHGVTCVELGVQSTDDEVLRRCGRSYGFRQVEEAVARLRGAGIGVGLQLMPGLPGAGAASDLSSARQVIALEPDSLRVYPTLVYRGTPLARDWEAGVYECLSLDEALDRSAETLALAHDAEIPVIRVGVHAASDDNPDLLAGPVHASFGYLAHVRALSLRIQRRVAALDASVKAVDVLVSDRDRGTLLGPRGEALERLQRVLAPILLRVAYGKDLKRGSLRLSW